MERFDVIVIGGGLLGCFAARNLTRNKLKIALLESREDVCTQISRANTAIVYSGCDTKSGTLKTRMCVKAAQSFERLCAELGVRYSRCGSLMVCFGERGESVLRKKYAQGIENGVRDIKLLTGAEVAIMEPGLSKNVRAGLFVPDTGTANPWELGIAAAENAVYNGAEITLNAKVTAIERSGDGFTITAGGGRFFARAVINCAGMASDGVHNMFSKPSACIVPTAGDYFVLDTKVKGSINHVIFHEPEQKGKGLTIVPTVGGNILIGPTERPVSVPYATEQCGFDELMPLVDEVAPVLTMNHVIRSFAACRPNPYTVRYDTESGKYIKDDRSVRDFCIIESEDNPPFISLIGIKTPGFTCANELGAHVTEKIIQKLGGAAVNPAYNPVNQKPVRTAELAFGDRAELVGKNPQYGKIVCRCGGISEGEIVDAIRKNPGAVTVDGVKRRAGTGMGRCQGGFCAQKVIEVLARELGVKPEDIQKDGAGSQILYSSEGQPGEKL